MLVKLTPGGDGVQLLDHAVQESLNLVDGKSDVKIEILLKTKIKKKIEKLFLSLLLSSLNSQNECYLML